jgi:hypothetical protein
MSYEVTLRIQHKAHAHKSKLTVLVPSDSATTFEQAALAAQRAPLPTGYSGYEVVGVIETRAL